jgi:hypothetical protein
MSTLFRDLHDRGLLDSTMVLVTGEFGRTPRINKDAGRDHWGPSTAIAIGGGGIRGGLVVGTSKRASREASNPSRGARKISRQLSITLSVLIRPPCSTRPNAAPCRLFPVAGELISPLFA